MPYCQYCGAKTDDDAVFCPKCGRSLVGEDVVWDEFQVREAIDGAKHRANMYTISAIVLVTVGIVAGGVLYLLANPLAFFGVAFVCMGIGCAAPADRYELKARNLKKLLGR